MLNGVNLVIYNEVICKMAQLRSKTELPAQCEALISVLAAPFEALSEDAVRSLMYDMFNLHALTSA